MALKYVKFFTGNRDYLYVERDDCAAIIANMQISSLVPQTEDCLSGGYWDNMLLFARIVEGLGKDRAKHLVLGGGLGSYVPSLTYYFKEHKVKAFELNSEIFFLSQALIKKNYSDANVEVINNNAINVSDDDLSQADCIFFDLYDDKGILDICLSKEIHKRIQDKAKEDVIVTFNVHDLFFNEKEKSLSYYYATILKQFYKYIYFAPDGNSASLICSNMNHGIDCVSQAVDWLNSLQVRQLKALQYDGFEVDPDRFVKKSFIEQVEMGGILQEYDGTLFTKLINDLKELDRLKILELMREKSNFL